MVVLLDLYMELETKNEGIRGMIFMKVITRDVSFQMKLSLLNLKL
jgi:hypothetical protein